MQISSITLGTFPLAGVFSQVDTLQARHIIEKYQENGGNFLDTAPLYAQGRVEEIIGTVIKNFAREGILLGTKCGYVWDDNKQVSKSGKYKDVIRGCEDSLKRMGVDYIDLYMSHIPDPNTPLTETMDAMMLLKKDGKIKHIGVCNVNLDQLKEYNQNGGVEFIQNRFSYLNRSLDQALVDYCVQHNVGITPYQVIERGLLTNKLIDGLYLREGDLRVTKPEFADQVKSEIAQWMMESVKPLATNMGVDISALATWWVLQQDSVVTAVLGATNEDQIVRNFQAARLQSNDDLLEQLNQAYLVLVNRVQQKYSKTIREFMGL